jgi:hypothetical protein
MIKLDIPGVFARSVRETAHTSKIPEVGKK